MQAVKGYEADGVYIDEAGKIDLPEAKKVEGEVVSLLKGEMVQIGGMDFKVLNFTPGSVTVRPALPMLLVFKDVPMYIHKMVGSDLVLRPATQEMVNAALKQG